MAQILLQFTSGLGMARDSWNVSIVVQVFIFLALTDHAAMRPETDFQALVAQQNFAGRRR